MHVNIAAERSLVAQRVRDALSYDAQTGIFMWRRKTRRRRAGAIAGCASPNGYRVIGINGRQYLAHRLAWLYVTGEWPRSLIDHVNGDRADNRFENLREATTSQNKVNTLIFRPGKSGCRGVRAKGSEWEARIQVNGKRFRIGKFSSLAEARDAYVARAREVFGQFARAEG